MVFVNLIKNTHIWNSVECSTDVDQIYSLLIELLLKESILSDYFILLKFFLFSNFH